MGPAATVSRLATVIEAVSALGYRRSEKRISSMTDGAYAPSAIEKRFWIGIKTMTDTPLVSGNLLDAKYECVIELARHFGGGDLLGKEYYSLNKTMSEDSAILMDSIMYPQNWDFSNTGLYMLGIDSPWSEAVADVDGQVMIWSTTLTLYIRRQSVHVAVA